MDNINVESSNDKLALINFSKYCVDYMKKTSSDDEIYSLLKNNFNFSDGFIDQII
jgi:hypothetical protein